MQLQSRFSPEIELQARFHGVTHFSPNGVTRGPAIDIDAPAGLEPPAPVAAEQAMLGEMATELEGSETEEVIMVAVESDAESIEEVSDEDDDNVAEAAAEMEVEVA